MIHMLGKKKFGMLFFWAQIYVVAKIIFCTSLNIIVLNVNKFHLHYSFGILNIFSHFLLQLVIFELSHGRSLQTFSASIILRLSF